MGQICRVGQNHTYIQIYGVYTVFLVGKLPYIPSYTVLANPVDMVVNQAEVSGRMGVVDESVNEAEVEGRMNADMFVNQAEVEGRIHVVDMVVNQAEVERRMHMVDMVVNQAEVSGRI